MFTQAPGTLDRHLERLSLKSHFVVLNRFQMDAHHSNHLRTTASKAVYNLLNYCSIFEHTFYSISVKQLKPIIQRPFGKCGFIFLNKSASSFCFKDLNTLLRIFKKESVWLNEAGFMLILKSSNEKLKHHPLIFSKQAGPHNPLKNKHDHQDTKSKFLPDS